MEKIITTTNLKRDFRIRQTGGAIRGYLRPKYNTLTALHGLNLDIQRGERVAFVGPNGAGKSTTIKILCGILYPSAGSAKVCGLTPWEARRQLAYKIGAVFGQRSQLWYHLPAKASFDLLAKIYELDASEYRKQVAELSERFQIQEFANRPVRQLSLGQRMRCEIVASLLHRPEVIFLDEPTIGLDVTAKAIIRDLVREMSEEQGTTLLLTSHDTGDMERVCQRVVVINEGALILDKPVDELRSSVISRKVITLLTKEEEPEFDIDGAEIIERAPYRTVFEIDTASLKVEEVVAQAANQVGLRDLRVEDPPMEEVVSLIYAGAANGIGEGGAAP